MHVLRRVLAVVASTALLAGVSLFASSAAQAATSCSGTVTYDQTVSRDGSAIGELVIYYNSSNGGTNSACFYHRGASYGVAATTSVEIYRCLQKSGTGGGCTVDVSSRVDKGSYAYNAGPVGVTGTANYCVYAYGYVDWAGHEYSVSSGTRGC
ncbi:hypothetical protein K353_00593 [Kitasatospora sp. SolWspMP-SS2h]|uniref:hypothetical protein n=1 Tax=Kitasatospora sp. SolWspMP-SS2h TaxID=1305729 RepID=UPI000DB92F67|nr:hypothetical protein [Kitasatospora sp. SolWspMP-SS2h]RAJ46218.1 hypothetical protein K353_00593 [Kitasatospora sp. SolWspMP-SS2h]